MGQSSEEQQRQIIDSLQVARRGIVEAARALPAGTHEIVFLGTWSLMDLLAHLVGWDHANVEGAQAILGGALPGFYAHHDADWATYNASLIAQFKEPSIDEQLVALNKSHQRLIQFALMIPAAEFLRDRGFRFKGWCVTVASMLQAEARDEEDHKKQMLDFAGRAAGLLVS